MKHTPLQVGAARIDITPKDAVELSGFAVREQPCVGVLHPVSARAVVFDDGSIRIVMLSLELLELPRDFANQLRVEIAEQAGTDTQHVCLSCTHTHAAPAVAHLRGTGRPDDWYLAYLVEQIKQVVRLAIDRLSPSRLVSRETPLRMGINRRASLRTDLGGPSGVEPTDQVLRSLAAIDDDGRVQFMALHHACHPVCLGAANRKISGDFCGIACNELEGRIDSDAVVIFLNGCAGDINPSVGMACSPQQTHEFAMQMLDAVSSLTFESSSDVNGVELVVRHQMIGLPYRPDTKAGLERKTANLQQELAELSSADTQAVRWVTLQLDYYRDTLEASERNELPTTCEVPIQYMQLGPVNLLTLAGEVFYEIGQQIKEQTQQPALWTVAYANGGFGYIPTREAQDEGGYEVDHAHCFYNQPRLEPAAADQLVRSSVALIESSRSSRTII